MIWRHSLLRPETLRRNSLFGRQDNVSTVSPFELRYFLDIPILVLLVGSLLLLDPISITSRSPSFVFFLYLFSMLYYLLKIYPAEQIVALQMSTSLIREDL